MPKTSFQGERGVCFFSGPREAEQRGETWSPSLMCGPLWQQVSHSESHIVMRNEKAQSPLHVLINQISFFVFFQYNISQKFFTTGVHKVVLATFCFSTRLPQQSESDPKVIRRVLRLETCTALDPCVLSAGALEQPRRLGPLRTCTRPIRVGLSKRAKARRLHHPHPYK